MDLPTFNKSFTLIQPQMIKRVHLKSSCNGPISPLVCLGCCLQYCAGGFAYIIAGMFGIAVSEVFESVWEVTKALNKTTVLDIVFPSSISKQKKLAKDFKAKSTAKIDCCVGAIDGILIWIH